MTPKQIKWISVLSALFWASLLISVCRSFSYPLPGDNEARQVVEYARMMRLVEVIAGVTFSLLVFRRPAAWAVIGLTCLTVLVLWTWYFGLLPWVFHPPLGDVTSERVAMVWRWFGPLFGWHIARVTLLIASVVVWPLVYWQLRRDSRRCDVQPQFTTG